MDPVCDVVAGPVVNDHVAGTLRDTKVSARRNCFWPKQSASADDPRWAAVFDHRSGAADHPADLATVAHNDNACDDGVRSKASPNSLLHHACALPEHDPRRHMGAYVV